MRWNSGKQPLILQATYSLAYYSLSIKIVFRFTRSGSDTNLPPNGRGMQKNNCFLADCAVGLESPYWNSVQDAL